MEKRTVVAPDIAKAVFELAVSGEPGRVSRTRRLARAELLPHFAAGADATVVMEACGSAHHWGRQLQKLGHQMVLLPPHQARPYVTRNKTVRTDAKGILEAYRNAARPQSAASMLRSGSRRGWLLASIRREEVPASNPAGPGMRRHARPRHHAGQDRGADLRRWNQPLGFHPHLHCLVPAGGLALDRSRWIPSSRRFFLPVKRLRKLFRAKLLAKLEHALRTGHILGQLDQDLALLRRTPNLWHVYAKRPLAGPAHVVRYLSRYVHRIALANSRITHYDGHNVTFRYKDRADGNTIKHRTVSAHDFARLSLQHVLPPRFVRTRHYGFLAARRRLDLARCRALLGAPPLAKPHKDSHWALACERLFGTNPLRRPACKTGVLVATHVLPPVRT